MLIGHGGRRLCYMVLAVTIFLESILAIIIAGHTRVQAIAHPEIAGVVVVDVFQQNSKPLWKKKN